MTTMWVVERPNGSQEVLAGPPHAERDAPINRRAKVDRLPTAEEDWSFDLGRWVLNADRALAAVNRDVEAERGSCAIDLARLAKAMEARQILAGIKIEGLVSAEARLLGMPVDVLARTIVAKADGANASELARIAQRRDVRAAVEASRSISTKE